MENDSIPMSDQPAKPQYIHEQHNTNCQQFFGPVSGCVFAMPGATVNQCAAPDKTEKPKAKRERTSSLPNLKQAQPDKPRERMTFSKRGILEEHLKLLYSKMIQEGWISKETGIDCFLDLFSGERNDCRIIWSDKYGKSTLVFLFQYMETEGVISYPKGFSLPNILMGHFVDTEGNYLSHLDKGNPPSEKAGKEMIEFMKILKINAGNTGRRAARIDHSDDEDSFGFDDAINENDIESDGLSIRKR